MATKYLPFQVLMNIIIITLLSISVQVFPASLTSNTGHGQPYLTRLDVESCQCLPVHRSCEVAVSSKILLSGFKCPPNQQYCCSTTKDTTISPPVVRIITADKMVPTPEHNANPVTKNRTTCICKLKDDCPEEYKDYGFDQERLCTAQQIKCCEPKVKVDIVEEENKFSGGGRLINVFANNDNNDKTTENCYCVPESKCRTGSDKQQLIKRRDLACPHDFIQCCGHAIAEKKSDQTVDDEHFDDKNDSLERLDNPQHQPLPLTTIHEVHRQPIQLPMSKIPQPSQEPAALELMISTLPPPQLPNYYHYSPPSSPTYYFRNNKGELFKMADTTPRPSQSSNYYYNANVPSWASRPDNPYLRMDNNGRGFVRRSSSSGNSFLSSIANFFG